MTLLLYANPFRSRFPMVEIEVPEEIQTGAFDVTVRFNEDVTGFEQADLLVSGAAATITEWAEVTAEREYTATITPTEDGTVTFTSFQRCRRREAQAGTSHLKGKQAEHENLPRNSGGQHQLSFKTRTALRPRRTLR